VDVVTDLNGNYVSTLAKRKIAMRSGEADIAETMSEPVLSNLGEQIALSLRHCAILDADIFLGPRGAHVVDLNPRFGGSYPFSHLAGANVPAAIVAWLTGAVPDPAWLKVRPGVVGCKGILPLAMCATPHHATAYCADT